MAKNQLDGHHTFLRCYYSHRIPTDQKLKVDGLIKNGTYKYAVLANDCSDEYEIILRKAGFTIFKLDKSSSKEQVQDVIKKILKIRESKLNESRTAFSLSDILNNSGFWIGKREIFKTIVEQRALKKSAREIRAWLIKNGYDEYSERQILRIVAKMTERFEVERKPPTMPLKANLSKASKYKRPD